MIVLPAMTLQCNKHPKYMGIREPKVECDACRDLYELYAAMKHVSGRHLQNDGTSVDWKHK